ncbi:MAG: hypothetical protein K2Y28_13605 [Burkholderiaceae bacterium]|nr:hypothetical protein [Burkholderiaceae bacterium]
MDLGIQPQLGDVLTTDFWILSREFFSFQTHIQNKPAMQKDALITGERYLFEGQAFEDQQFEHSIGIFSTMSKRNQHLEKSQGFIVINLISRFGVYRIVKKIY